MNRVIVKLLVQLFDQEPSAKDIREFRRVRKDFEKMLEVTSKIQEALSPPHQHRPAPGPPPLPHDFNARCAAMFLSAHSGIPASTILANAAEREKANRLASRKLHPDAGGSTAEFQELAEANRLLKEYQTPMKKKQKETKQ